MLTGHGETFTLARARRGRARGITLAEVLTAVLVLGVIIVPVTSIYMTSLRTWGRGSAETYAQQKAAWAVQRMSSDIRQGLSVTPGNAPFESSYIAVHLPNRLYDDTQRTHLNEIRVDGHGQPYLVPGGYAVYYRGDAGGSMSITGDRIWRRLLASDGTTLIHEDVIADNVVDNPPDDAGSATPLFVYWPDTYRLNSVEATVTVHQRVGGRAATKTMTAEFALRNR